MRAPSRVKRMISRISLSSETIRLKQEKPAIFVERAREVRHVSARGGFLFCSSASDASLGFPAPRMMGDGHHPFFLFGYAAGSSFRAEAFFLSAEIFVDDATGAVRHIRIVGKRFQLAFHLRRNRHLTAGAERLSRPDPITVVVIPNLFDVA